jgi:hypothetical protein
MKKILPVLVIALILSFALPIQEHACTTAVISPGAASQGRPLLWKNRDTAKTPFLTWP